jgi:hypothetical protein
MIYQLTIDGVEVRLRFGMHALECIAQVVDGTFSNTKFVAVMIYASHENYCLGADVPAVVTKAQVYNFVEDAFLNKNEADLKAIQDVTAAFNDSRTAKQVTEGEGEGKTAKKK